jgi:flagellar motor component MotA
MPDTATILSETYRGRELLAVEERTWDETADPFVQVYVNGARQFNYVQGTDAEFIRGELQRYINAVDAANAKHADLELAGGYVEQRRADFSRAWRA